MKSTAKKLDPAAEARRILTKLKIDRPPVPIEKIAKYLGALVRFSPLDDEISGMVFVKDGLPIIGVNALHHSNRQRFTMAHEIGHLVLHRDFVESNVHVDKQYRVLMRDPRSSAGIHSLEIEANQFAAELLMPRAILEQVLDDLVLDLDDDKLLEALSQQFRVSKRAMSYRLSGSYLSAA